MTTLSAAAPGQPAIVSAWASRRPRHGAQITVQVGDGVVAVAVTGRIDQFTVAAFRQELLDIWQDCVGTLVVDLSDCTHLTTDAVDTLRTVRGRSPSGQCHLQICADHPDVLAVLDTANIAWSHAASDHARPEPAPSPMGQSLDRFREHQPSNTADAPAQRQQTEPTTR
jgi:anti-anti-sigma regulatory factor